MVVVDGIRQVLGQAVAVEVEQVRLVSALLLLVSDILLQMAVLVEPLQFQVHQLLMLVAAVAVAHTALLVQVVLAVVVQVMLLQVVLQLMELQILAAEAVAETPAVVQAL
jgi:hypothetical protein